MPAMHVKIFVNRTAKVPAILGMAAHQPRLGYRLPIPLPFIASSACKTLGLVERDTDEVLHRHKTILSRLALYVGQALDVALDRARSPRRMCMVVRHDGSFVQNRAEFDNAFVRVFTCTNSLQRSSFRMIVIARYCTVHIQGAGC